MTDTAPTSTTDVADGENVELARHVLRYVIAHPERHRQGTWLDPDDAGRYEYYVAYVAPRDDDRRVVVDRVDPDALTCPTTGCLAGWTLVLAGGEPGTPDARRSLVRGLLEVADVTGGWDAMFGASGAYAWTAVAADRLRVTDPGRVRRLNDVFMTTFDESYGFESAEEITGEEAAGRRFAELFGLDYDALRAEVAAELDAVENAG